MDVLLSQTQNDGDIEVINGQVTLCSGLETSVYLSLFGGNESGSDWWGNLEETPSYQYVSETQRILKEIPAIPSNLRRVEECAYSDLKYLIDIKAASDVSATASMPDRSTLQLNISIVAEGVANDFEFYMNWSNAL